jgi:hypothetical protein
VSSLDELRAAVVQAEVRLAADREQLTARQAEATTIRSLTHANEMDGVDPGDLRERVSEAESRRFLAMGQVERSARELDAAMRAYIDALEQTPRAALAQHDPAHQVAAEDIGILAADLEPLLLLADRYVDDDTRPPDLRAAVETRARTLRGELRLFGDEPHDAIIITRTAAYLIATLTPQVIDAAGDQLPDETAAALDAVAQGTQLLGDDDTAVEGGTTIAHALDPVEPGDAADPGEEQPYRDAARRGLANWIEHDLFTTHLNRIVTASLTVGGIAGIEATTGGASALLRAGRALLRARFPWIFT